MDAGINDINHYMTQPIIADNIHIEDDKTIVDTIFLLIFTTVENLGLALYFQDPGIINSQIRNDHPGHQDILFGRNINGEARG